MAQSNIMVILNPNLEKNNFLPFSIFFSILKAVDSPLNKVPKNIAQKLHFDLCKILERFAQRDEGKNRQTEASWVIVMSNSCRSCLSFRLNVRDMCQPELVTKATFWPMWRGHTLSLLCKMQSVSHVFQELCWKCFHYNRFRKGPNCWPVLMFWPQINPVQ